eukprot:gene17247-16222_t
MEGGVRPSRSLSGDPITDELEACAEILGSSFHATTSADELEALLNMGRLPNRRPPPVLEQLDAGAEGNSSGGAAAAAAADLPKRNGSLVDDAYLDAAAGIIALAELEVNPFAEDEERVLYIYIDGKTITVRHLPPVVLSVALPSGYPSTPEAPPFRITSNWLPLKVLTTLASELEEQWAEEECLFLWGEHLAQRTLEALQEYVEEAGQAVEGTDAASWGGGGAVAAAPTTSATKAAAAPLPAAGDGEEEDAPLHIDPTGSSYSFSTMASGPWEVLCTADTAAAVHTALQSYHGELDAKTERECQICLETPLGACFVTNISCGHRSLCDLCAEGLCNVNIDHGSIDDIQCADCGEALHNETIRSLVDPLRYAKFEKFQLQRAIEKMDDLAPCPRCTAMAAVDSNFAKCPGCMFGFCVRCTEPWHEGECLNLLDKADELEARAGGAGAGAGGGGRKQSHLSEQLQMRIRDLRAQAKSIAAITATAVRCPGCGEAIVKESGCNKMCCSTCHTYFCYACLSILDKSNPYGHFNTVGTRCELFAGQGLRPADQGGAFAPVDRNAAAPARFRDARNRGIRQMELARAVAGAEGVGAVLFVRCPMCKAQSARQGNANNVNCWNCFRQYCAACSKPLQKGKVGKHYGPAGCPQHQVQIGAGNQMLAAAEAAVAEIEEAANLPI